VKLAMTPQLEAAIAFIQQLSPTEQQQLLQILTQNDSAPSAQSDFRTRSTQFWQGISLKHLITQTSRTVPNLKDLTADFWPAEDSIEDFLVFLQQQRQEHI
jgi:hypothetical protein